MHDYFGLQIDPFERRFVGPNGSVLARRNVAHEQMAVRHIRQRQQNETSYVVAG